MRSREPFYVAEDDSPAKRAILRAALRQFSERGLAATSIRSIAAESGFTNPALYKHFASKDDLALYLFEVCHAWVWERCAATLEGEGDFEAKLDNYLAAWLELHDEEPQVLAFLSDSARVLWPRASATTQRKTMIGLARRLMAEAPGVRQAGGQVALDVAAAALQGTLAELGRMIQVGVAPGPASQWRDRLFALFTRLSA
jgi:AcrR family transcriptional regulator